jgi:hypothetical protein
MPPVNRKLVIQAMLNALTAPTKPLTQWEEKFLESIGEDFDAKGTLSEKQFAVLDRIYNAKAN